MRTLTRPFLLLLAVTVTLAGCTKAVVVDDTAGPITGTFVINEYMPSNQSTVADEGGAYPDWIELYNGTSDAIVLDGYSIGQDPAAPSGDALDGLEIDSADYLLLWADGDVDEGDNHLEFRLSKAGEDLVLFDPDGLILDETSWTDAETDSSEARSVDGGGEWYRTASPTPGAAN